MTPAARIFVVVPAYNEAQNLPYLLANLARMERFLEVRLLPVVVDDGSTDDTAQALERYQGPLALTVLRHDVNRGPGAAFRTGFLHVLGLAADDEIALTIEADNTSDLCVLGRMIERLDRGGDLVLASVYGAGHIAGSTLWRRVLSFGANSLMRATFRIPEVNTFTSFFRLYRCRALRELFDAFGDRAIEERGFTCMLEVLVKLHQLGARIDQVPVLLDGRMRLGESKMKVVKNTRATLALMARYVAGDHFRPPREAVGRLRRAAEGAAVDARRPH